MDPLPRPRPEPSPGEPISVGALLRREGRWRHALDRPLVPRGHSRTEPTSLVPLPRRSMRKAVTAAGALFAVGAVFGGASLDESLGGSRPDPAGDADETSGSRLPPEATTRGEPGGAVVTLAAETSGLLPDDGRAFPPVSGAGVAGSVLPPGVTIPTQRTDSPPAPPDPPASGSVDDPGDGPGGGPGATPGGGPGGGGPGGGPATTVPVPDLHTPAVEVPGVQPPGAPAATPRITVSETALHTPDLSLADGTPSVSRTGLTTPDVHVSAVDVGPVGLGETAVVLPDVELPEAQTPPPPAPAVPVVEAVASTAGALLGD